MSCTESAEKFAREKAEEFEAESRKYGILRSVDATEASHWLWSVAAAIREALGDEPTPRRKKRSSKP